MTDAIRANGYGDPSFYVIQRDQALRSVKTLTGQLEDLREKLSDANRRANAAEGRASQEQKRREKAEAALEATASASQSPAHLGNQEGDSQ
jgi:chromosome segregation ATPase